MIRLVFTSAPGVVAAVIRWITGGRVSHVGIQEPGGMFLHADSGGVRETTLEAFLTGGRRVHSVWRVKPEVEPLLSLAHARVAIGDAYDYDGLIGAMIPVLSWRWFREKLSNPLRDPNEFFCSEFVFQIDPDRVLLEFRGMDPAATSPAMLETALRAARDGSFVREPSDVVAP